MLLGRHIDTVVAVSRSGAEGLVDEDGGDAAGRPGSSADPLHGVVDIPAPVDVTGGSLSELAPSAEVSSVEVSSVEVSSVEVSSPEARQDGAGQPG